MRSLKQQAHFWVGNINELLGYFVVTDDVFELGF